MTLGVQLRRLAVTGPEVPEAVVTFAPGLNYISGPSNTGKSYLLQCIDWVFGAKRPLRRFAEVEGYEKVWLELATEDGSRVTLERALGAGAIGLVEDALSTVTPPRLLSPRSNARDSVSDYLLSLFGAAGAKVAANAQGKTQKLSFRTIEHLFLVSETRIIAEESPILHEQSVAKTSSESAFRYLLSGSDDSALISAPDQKLARAGWAGKREMLDRLVADLEDELERAGKVEEPDPSALLEERLNALSASVEESTRAIALEWQLRHEQWQQFREKDTRLVALRELEKRYELLRQHYRSDLDRLEFIAEGDHYLQQLETARCPLCGCSLDEHAVRRLCSHEATTPAVVAGACDAEAAKIRRQLADLEGALKDIQGEAAVLRGEIQLLREEIRSREAHIREDLEPAASSTKAEIEALLAARRRGDIARVQRDRLEALMTARRQLDEQHPATQDRATPPRGAFEPRHLRGLCNEVAALLTEWRFPFRTVDFSDRAMDLVVDGKERRANGKGVRAILHAAFSIAFLRYARRNGRHPGFLLLDSPLTTFREGHREAGDEIMGEVQNAFLDSLAGFSASEQIIVMENKEPSPSVVDRINYVPFVGPGLPGRGGFFPVQDGRG